MGSQPEPIGCLGLLLSVLGIRPRLEPERLPYRLRTELLTPAERSFYGVLLKAVGDRAIVFAKVRVSDLLFVPGGEGRRGHENRINMKHVDFVLCSPDTVRPIAAIELDDSSHKRADRVKRDDFLNEAFEAARLPLIRFAVRHQYEIHEIARNLEPAFTPSTSSGSPKSTDDSGLPNCPSCETLMVLRTATSGRNKGSKFYGCTNYPKCRETKPAE
mgnify:FL=1